MNSSVVYGRLIGLEDIFAQCSVQDCARLLNEFSTRINRIAEVRPFQTKCYATLLIAYCILYYLSRKMIR